MVGCPVDENDGGDALVAVRQQQRPGEPDLAVGKGDFLLPRGGSCHGSRGKKAADCQGQYREYAEMH